ncbi:dihydroorotate dehydrogenase domain-containing protein [Ditylenchus destructor]|uniref:dihydropyrimidine dehydrogenase (NADP(+)) n=1 Tax=Ditylenchus destructor TaxID=166010 RepID=A0AAD4MFY3_9BILA|nr:dihydroorotate dehydrogenase domain-containing protein [Ditylenchus destructor]
MPPIRSTACWPPVRSPPLPSLEGDETWLIFVTISSASSRPTPSGWPPRRPPTRPTTWSAPTRRAGAGWSGRPSARKGRRSSRQRPALRRDLGCRPPAPRPEQHRAHHRPRPLHQPARDEAGQDELAGPGAHRLDHGALRGGELEGDPAAGGRDRRRRHRTQLRLSARHVRARHGGRRRPGARIIEMSCAGASSTRACPSSPADAQYHRHPQAPPRGQAGGTDAVSLINTINSIVSVDLDNFAPNPTVGGKGTHGGYCGPAVKPIALNMVAEIARDPETYGMPISGIGGITTWRDAAEFLVLGAGNVQVCTAAMTYGFKIVQEMISGPLRLDGRKGHRTLDDICGRAVPNVTDWQYLNLNYIAKARIDQDACIKCGRCHIACEDTSHQAITQFVDGVRHFEVMEDESSAAISASTSARSRTASPWSGLKPACSTRRTGKRGSIRTTPTGPRIEQPDGQAGRGVTHVDGTAPTIRRRPVHPQKLLRP